MAKYVPKKVNQDVNVSPVHPLRDLMVLLGGIALIAALFVGATILFIRFAANQLSLENEIKYLSLGHYTKSFGDKDLIKDKSPWLSQLVDNLNHPFSDNGKIKLSSYVIQKNDINAFAAPGGRIFVTSGLIEKAESENELAFVICHEIGHHYNRDILKGMGTQAVVGLALSLLDVDTHVLDTAARLSLLKFSRDTETAADEFALNCLRRRYGHAQGPEDFFKRLIAEKSALENSGFSEFLSTHPVSQNRIDHLQAYARENAWPLNGQLTKIKNN